MIKWLLGWLAKRSMIASDRQYEEDRRRVTRVLYRENLLHDHYYEDEEEAPLPASESTHPTRDYDGEFIVLMYRAGDLVGYMDLNTWLARGGTLAEIGLTEADV